MNATTREEKYNNFRKAFLELRGCGLYIIEEKPIHKRIIEPGGYDHLGPLPDKCYDVVDHYEKYVKPIIVDEYNLHKILKKKVYFSREDAEWALLIQQKKEGDGE